MLSKKQFGNGFSKIEKYTRAVFIRGSPTVPEAEGRLKIVTSKWQCSIWLNSSGLFPGNLPSIAWPAVASRSNLVAA
jgi:hypothetical protein